MLDQPAIWLVDRVRKLVHLLPPMIIKMSKPFIPCLTAFVLPLVLMLGSCAPSGPSNSGYMAGVRGTVQQQVSNGPHHPPPAVHDDISYWEGDGVTGAPLVRINRPQQKAYFYKGGVLVGISKISSGSEDHATPPGRYKITQKSKDHKSSIYGVFKDKATGQMINDNVDIRVDKIPPGAVYYAAPMPNFMRFTGGIGMHTGYLPGYAASHGCIRMPHHMSEKFFENVEIGTPVIVD
jgi:hypothetical protein